MTDRRMYDMGSLSNSGDRTTRRQKAITTIAVRLLCCCGSHPKVRPHCIALWGHSFIVDFVRCGE